MTSHIHYIGTLVAMAGIWISWWVGDGHAMIAFSIALLVVATSHYLHDLRRRG